MKNPFKMSFDRFETELCVTRGINIPNIQFLNLQKILWLIFLLVPLFNHGQDIQKSPSRENSSSFVFIDLNALSNEEKNRLLSFQTKKSLANKLIDTIVSKEKGLDKFIASYSNLNARTNSSGFSEIKNAIVKLNGPLATKSIVKGNKILTPSTFRIPKKNSSVSYFQSIDTVSGRVVALPISFVQQDSIAQDSSAIILPEQTSLLKLDLSPEELDELKSKVFGGGLEKANKNAIRVLNKSDRYVAVEFPADTLSLDTINSVSISSIYNFSDTLKSKLSILNKDNFGEYYVLDFFTEGDCSHGQKVVSVVKQKFQELGIDLSYLKLKIISIDYRHDPQKALDFLTNYYSQLDLDLDRVFGQFLIDGLKSNANHVDEICAKCIPSEILQAYLSDSYNNKPDIISTSFYISTSKPVFPNPVLSPTTFITACLNETNRRIESLDELDSSSPTAQPLTALYKTKGYGCITVSSQIKSGSFNGMYSENASGVTTIGKGGGWEFSKYCSKPLIGASFAVPDIGATMLIAKAYWRAKNFVPDAEEAKVRLLLSCDLDSNLVSKFGSGGRINLEKLINFKNGFCEDLDGRISPCFIKKGSKVFGYNFKRGMKNDDVSGIAFISDKTYFFSELASRWQHNLSSDIDITIIKDGFEERFTSIDQIKAKYKHVTNFNK